MIRSVVRFLAGLAVVALVVWGVVEVGGWLVKLVTEAESGVASASIAASIAVIGSVLSLAVGKAYETRAALRSELREKKTPVYEDIVQTLLHDVMFAKMIGREPPNQTELMEFFARVTEKLTIWGSDDVLRAYGDFKTKSGSTSDPMSSVFRFEDLLLALRKDLGHRNRGIGRKSILKLFVTDIDEVSPPM